MIFLDQNLKIMPNFYSNLTSKRFIVRKRGGKMNKIILFDSDVRRTARSCFNFSVPY